MIHFTFRCAPSQGASLHTAVATTMQDAIDLIEAKHQVGGLRVEHVRMATYEDLVDKTNLVSQDALQNPMMWPLEDFQKGLQAQHVDASAPYAEVSEDIMVTYGSKFDDARNRETYLLDVYNVPEGKRFRILMPSGVQYFADPSK